MSKMDKSEKPENKKSMWDEKLTEWITPKVLAVFLTVCYVLSLIPLLWIAWYNYPSADDYSIGSNCRQVWVNTHNIFVVIWQGIERAAEDWLHWMGYFTSNYLMAVPPNTFGERWYVLTTWVMLGMLTFSVIYLFHAIFVKLFKADRYVSLSVSILVLFVSVQCMCPEGRVEAFYWYSGAANYIFVHSMSLFFYGLLISAVFDNGRKRIWDVVMASFLGFLTGGGNQMTALNVAVVLLVMTGIITWQKKWESCKVLRLPVGIFYLGFLLNIGAPGNWVRAEGTSGMNPIKAVFVSFYECLDKMMNQWTTWSVIVVMIALIPLFWYIAGHTDFRFPYPLAVVAFGFCLASAMVTPPLFAVGNMAAGRLQALSFLMYILVLALCVGYVTGWVRKRQGSDQEAEEMKSGRTKQQDRQKGSFSPQSRLCLLGCAAFLIFGSALTLIPEPRYYTCSSAAVDLLNGSAKEYGEALKKRGELYRSGAKGVIEVEPLPCQPALLYFSDIKEDREDWENRGLCRFYGLDGVVVKKTQ